MSTDPNTRAPTAAEINDLPAPIRAYVHQLETRYADPAGDTLKLMLGQDIIRQLSAALADRDRRQLATVDTIDRLLRDVGDFIGDLRADAMDETPYRKIGQKIAVARRLLARLVK